MWATWALSEVDHRLTYTHSGTFSPTSVRIQVHFHENEYMHEQTTIGFYAHIWGRKYLNECTPFSPVSLWDVRSKKLTKSLLQNNLFICGHLHKITFCITIWALGCLVATGCTFLKHALCFADQLGDWGRPVCAQGPVLMESAANFLALGEIAKNSKHVLSSLLFLSTPVFMHGGLICITLRLSVRPSVRDLTKMVKIQARK